MPPLFIHLKNAPHFDYIIAHMQFQPPPNEIQIPAFCLSGRARPRDPVSRLCGASFHDAPRNSASPNSEMRRWRRIGKGFPLDSHYFQRAYEGRKRLEASLHRLLAFSHADSLIPAGRFFRKEKSSPLRAGVLSAPHSSCSPRDVLSRGHDIAGVGADSFMQSGEHFWKILNRPCRLRGNI